jgi:DNA repair protein RecO (recombination protein O)
MPEPREYQIEAVITRKVKLGEADRILTLYTPDRGKIEAVAKGVRKTKSKMAGHLELLTYSQVRLARGRSLDTIIGSQTIESFMSLKNDLWLTSCALYCAELINQFTVAHVAIPSLFRFFLETLNYLSSSTNTDLTLRYFELNLLEMTGYRPQIQECTACHKPLKPETNYFDYKAGGAICPECELRCPGCFEISLDALKVMRLFQKCSFSMVERLKISPALSQELKTITSGYIRYHLEREVKSAAWLDTLNDQIAQFSKSE